MGKGRRVVARCGTRALVVATVAAGGLAAVAAPAYAAVPTVSSVVVAGTTNKVVTSGTTVLITGTGFSGMTDNAAAGGCSIAPIAWPTANSGCSQVRFVGVSANATTGYTLATRYNVISDTQMYATVPTITPVDGTTAGSPAAGTGSIRVQVVNTTATGTSSGVSVSSQSEIFYRAPLTASLGGTDVNANPLGGGTLPVQITAGVAPMTTSALFTAEKITAYLSSTVGGSPTVAPANVTWKDADEVNVALPPQSATGDYVSVMLVHDGVAGTADSDDLKFPSVITGIQSCADAAATSTWIGAPTTTFPTCTGTANAPTSGAAAFKITGKGLTSSAGTWSFDGTGGTVTETCLVASDTTVYCHISVTTPPPSGVAPVTFTPTAVGSSAAAALVPTAGGIVLYSTLV
ncbi:hypothetical protein Ait01nite_060690 [Actinoplanes italicus]|uniref:IPT/TIG domain-containing protein n=1 Tax=Actinoplanes italicus TaxID=113567 RepID=A0A2T0K6R3_9ACTN|nr:hypothetical protein [Actinoplanes italicus]PRX18683.1 hypothetical protein CLV67_112158 [Actinoplanes italicus]GIE33024.1 hypothetical protein Ait01nite_060690 [Actinoplanes italicus]